MIQILNLNLMNIGILNKKVFMKFLKNEIIEHSSCIENMIYVFGGNKKAHLGYFSNGDFFAFFENKNQKLDKKNIFILKETLYNKEKIEEVKNIFSKEWFKLFKEELFEQRIKYTAAILTENSRHILVERMKDFIPNKWNIIAHHMTINLGEPSSKLKQSIGETVFLTIKEFSISKELMVFAVKVESDVFSRNELKHITVAIDFENGAKAMDSNKLTEFQSINEFVLEAKIGCVLNNNKEVFELIAHS